MARYFFGIPEAGVVRDANFEQITNVVKGRSIVSLADRGTNRLDLGLSGSAMLRMTATDDFLSIDVFSTANSGEPSGTPLPLGEMPQRVEARILERKVRGLRTAYAIFYLLETGKVGLLQAYIMRHPYGDIEGALLEDDECLYIESISYGSWVVTAYTKTKEGIRALGNAVGIVYQRGREAWLQTLENKARMTGAEADRKEVEVARAKFELDRDRADYALSLINRMENPEARERAQIRLQQALRQLVSGDETEERRRLRLPAPGADRRTDQNEEH
jgi:hypothetical protein